MKVATIVLLLFAIASGVVAVSCSHRAPTAAPSSGLRLSVCSPVYQEVTLEGDRICRYNRRDILWLGKLTVDEEARGVNLIRAVAKGREHVHLESSACEEIIISTRSEPEFLTIKLDEPHDPAVGDLLTWFDEIGTKYL